MERTISLASTSVSGWMRNATSRISSTWMPPSPNMISGPNDGSCVSPTMTSTPPSHHLLHDNALHLNEAAGRAQALADRLERLAHSLFRLHAQDDAADVGLVGDRGGGKLDGDWEAHRLCGLHRFVGGGCEARRRRCGCRSVEQFDAVFGGQPYAGRLVAGKSALDDRLRAFAAEAVDIGTAPFGRRRQSA